MSGEPSTRDLVRPIMLRRGADRTVRNVATWTGRPKAEVEAEIEAMEREGLIQQLRKPNGERFWVLR